jgi:hypothetical protein
MTGPLQKQLDEVRAIARELNSAIDEVNKVVKHVETVLVKETKIGITVFSKFDSDYRRVEDEHGETVEEEVCSYIKFGRIDGDYCIHITRRTFRESHAGSGHFQNEIRSESTLWSGCDRETRLAAFRKLPELVQSIIDEARKLAGSAKETAAQVKELTGDEPPDDDGWDWRTESEPFVPDVDGAVSYMLSRNKAKLPARRGIRRVRKTEVSGDC